MREEKRWLCHENGFSHFSFGCKSYKQSGCEGPSPTTTPINHKIPYSESENIRESNLDFTAHFGEISPDMQTRSVGAQKGRFCLFSLCSERVDEKKTLNLRFFAKKTSKFLSSPPFKM